MIGESNLDQAVVEQSVNPSHEPVDCWCHGGLLQAVKKLVGDGMKGPSRFYFTSILNRDIGRLPAVDYPHAYK